MQINKYNIQNSLYILKFITVYSVIQARIPAVSASLHLPPYLRTTIIIPTPTFGTSWSLIPHHLFPRFIATGSPLSFLGILWQSYTWPFCSPVFLLLNPSCALSFRCCPLQQAILESSGWTPLFPNCHIFTPMVQLVHCLGIHLLIFLLPKINCIHSCTQNWHPVDGH